MKTEHFSGRSLFRAQVASSAALLLALGCGAQDEPNPDGGSGGLSASGGSGAGGATGTGGTTGTGGMATGGLATGGATTGGTVTGGAATGGAATGGAVTGGATTGGSTTGGTVTGGAATGGATTGGTVTGGAATGGAATGGDATGGTVTGGAATGGAATGGTVTGGAATGGAATGGSPPTGGTGGTAGGNGGSATGGTAGFPGCSVQPPAGSPVARHGQLSVVGTRVEDQAGNGVQLKGVSSYWLNWASRLYAESRPGLEYARDNWDMTVIRAAMGIDVAGAYLDDPAAMQAKVDTIVENALAVGMYVIVDWHEESAPDHQADSIAFFTALAEKYGDCPNLLYEDYNEPTGRTWDQIRPYHQAVVDAIRPIDPDNLIILGTPNWSQQVDVAAEDPVAGTNLLYTLHFYSCSHSQWLRDRGDTAMSLGAALFVTEFGATHADGGTDGLVCTTEADAWFSWMEQNGIGGAAWKFHTGSDSSNIFTSAAPVDGPWPDSVLTETDGSPAGHGRFIVDWIRQ